LLSASRNPLAPEYLSSLPIVGVNTFLPDNAGGAEVRNAGLIRSTEEEKRGQVVAVRAFNDAHADRQAAALERLQQVAATGGNTFAELMHAVQVASLGHISGALYGVGGQYRRNM